MPGREKFDYGLFMERAMRGVMADVLGYVARYGLPGEHYFYITFDTTHPGVDIPDWLRERYPREMMIVLQEWFEDLAVMQDRFRVTLNFSDNPETLVIPFEAVKTFIDPAAKFGLKFDSQSGEVPGGLDEEAMFEVDAPTAARPAEMPASAEAPDGDDGDGGNGGSRASGKVVSLDRFRKG